MLIRAIAQQENAKTQLQTVLNAASAGIAPSKPVNVKKVYRKGYNSVASFK